MVGYDVAISFSRAMFNTFVVFVAALACAIPLLGRKRFRYCIGNRTDLLLDLEFSMCQCESSAQLVGNSWYL